MGSTAGTDPASPALWRAQHAGGAFRDDIAACRALVAERRGPHYLAHSTYGLRDFAVGVQDSWPGGGQLADELDSAGSQLSLAVTQLGEVCQPLDSGPLIRLVLHGSCGAFFEIVKVPGQSFFGVTFDGSEAAVDHADRQLAVLARESVHRLGGHSLNWGGFRKREDSGDLWLPYRTPAGTGACVPAVTVAEAVPEAVTGPCLAALSLDDLHAVGIYRRGQLAWAADLFDAPVLAPFFQRVSPQFRRRGYTRVAHQVTLQSRRFSRLLDLTGSRELVRLVLDVARGAMYALPLGSEEYLVGVTLVQSRVDQADRKLRDLLARIRPA